MTDIVERLRKFLELPGGGPAINQEAADEIERLRSMYQKSDIENDELRASEERLEKQNAELIERLRVEDAQATAIRALKDKPLPRSGK